MKQNTVHIAGVGIDSSIPSKIGEGEQPGCILLAFYRYYVPYDIIKAMIRQVGYGWVVGAGYVC